MKIFEQFLPVLDNKRDEDNFRRRKVSQTLIAVGKIFAQKYLPSRTKEKFFDLFSHRGEEKIANYEKHLLL